MAAEGLITFDELRNEVAVLKRLAKPPRPAETKEAGSSPRAVN
jgi:hypothetical protein